MARYKKIEGKMMWGYPGSLIQQNYGENLLGHGFLVWDLNFGAVTAFHVNNDCGMANVRYINSDWCAHLSYPGIDRHEPLQNCINQNWFPRNIGVRIKGAHTDYKDLALLLQKESIVCKDYKISLDKIDKSVLNDNVDTDVNFDDLYSRSFWIESMRKIFKEKNIKMSPNWERWLQQPENLLLQSQYSINIADKNKKITDEITAYNSLNSQLIMTKHAQFKIVYMKWNYMLCYGADNYFDFRKLDNKVSAINGLNGSGKSAFLEIIAVSLFGTGFPSRTNKNYSASIINVQKPANSISDTQIFFMLDDKTYSIKRNYTYQDTTKKRIKTKSQTVYFHPLFDIDTKGDVVCDKENANKWILERLSGINEFLMTSIITQTRDNDYFDIDTSAKQMEVIVASLNLDALSKYSPIIHTSFLAHKSILSRLRDIYSVKVTELQKIKIIDTGAVLSQIKDEKERIMAIEKEISRISANLASCKNGELFNEELSFLDSQIEAINSRLPENFIPDLEKYKTRCAVIEHELNNYKHVVCEEGWCLKDLEANPVLKPANYCSGIFIDPHLEDRLSGQILVFEGAIERLRLTLQNLTIKKAELRLTVELYNNAIRECTEKIHNAYKNRPRVDSSKGLEHTDWIKERGAFLSKYGSLESLENKVCNSQKKTLTWIRALSEYGINDPSNYLTEYDKWISEYEKIVHLRSNLQDKITEARLRVAASFLKVKRAFLLDELRCLELELLNIPYIETGDYIKFICLHHEYTVNRYDFSTIDNGDYIADYFSWVKLETLTDYWSEWVKESARLKEWEIQTFALSKELKDSEGALKKVSGDFECASAEFIAAEKSLFENEQQLNATKNELTSVRDKKNKYSLSIEYDQWVKKVSDVRSFIKKGELDRELDEIRETIRVQTLNIELFDKKAEITQCISLYSDFLALRVLKDEVETRLKSIDTHNIEYGKSYTHADHRDDCDNEVRLLSGVLCEFETAVNDLEILDREFELYVESVLSEYALPKILKFCNKILGYISQSHRKIMLDCQREEKSFSWYLLDYNSIDYKRIPMSKVSGYQKFACSLAMRITLGKLRFSKSHATQLFIDEGFTACDYDNLSIVPELLHGFLNNYDSVMIVTHLNSLTENCDQQIEFSKNTKNKMSQLQF
jgi:DNA repair exonuclease SbcCD ATPase subunit